MGMTVLLSIAYCAIDCYVCLPWTNASLFYVMRFCSAYVSAGICLLIYFEMYVHTLPMALSHLSSHKVGQNREN